MNMRKMYTILLSIGVGLTNDVGLTTEHSPIIIPTPLLHVDPKNTVLLFDMNGVLFDVDWRGVAFTGPRTVCNGDIFREFARIRKQYPNNSTALRDAFKMIASCQIPNIPLWQAIRACKEQGCAIYIFTNSRQETYRLLQDKFPHLFACIDGDIYVSQENQWLTKHDPRYYKLCMSRIQQDGHAGKRIIFFDDTKKNIAQGNLCGWDSILVTKKETTCISELNARGLPVTPQTKISDSAFQPIVTVTTGTLHTQKSDK